MSSPDTPMLQVETPEDLDALFARSEQHPVMVLKHSTRCAISSFAFREFSEYATGAVERGVECAVVLVVEHRPVSSALAERVGVRHQSPQAILLRGGSAVWNDSHEGVNVAALQRAEG